jgi:hypothetical protein
MCVSSQLERASNVVFQERTGQVTISKFLRDKKARKWLWVGLAAYIGLQIYFVQEMVAALIFFTIAFILFAIFAGVLYLVNRAGEWGLGWAGQQSKPAVELARRGFNAVEDVSKKQLRRPRSVPVR